MFQLDFVLVLVVSSELGYNLSLPLIGWGNKASCQVPPPLQDLSESRSISTGEYV